MPRLRRGQAVLALSEGGAGLPRLPAYFTILIVGHVIVAPLLLFPFIWQAPVAVVLASTLLPLTGATLLLLPRIKGAFIGGLYALGVKEKDAALHTADAAD